MYLFLAIFAGLSVAGLVMLIRAARSAPEGFQDAKGFHALNPDDLAAPKSAEASFSLEEMLLLDGQMTSQPWR